MEYYKLADSKNIAAIALWLERGSQVFKGFQMNVEIDVNGNLCCNKFEGQNENYPFMDEIAACPLIEFVTINN